jgi:hypothetical protein
MEVTSVRDYEEQLGLLGREQDECRLVISSIVYVLQRELRLWQRNRLQQRTRTQSPYAQYGVITHADEVLWIPVYDNQRPSLGLLFI